MYAVQTPINILFFHNFLRNTPANFNRDDDLIKASIFDLTAYFNEKLLKREVN